MFSHHLTWPDLGKMTDDIFGYVNISNENDNNENRMGCFNDPA